MRYDWAGVRTRRIRRLKVTMYTTLALLALISPAAFLPIDLELLAAFVR